MLKTYIKFASFFFFFFSNIFEEFQRTFEVFSIYISLYTKQIETLIYVSCHILFHNYFSLLLLKWNKTKANVKIVSATLIFVVVVVNCFDKKKQN